MNPTSNATQSQSGSPSSSSPSVLGAPPMEALASDLYEQEKRGSSDGSLADRTAASSPSSLTTASTTTFTTTTTTTTSTTTPLSSPGRWSRKFTFQSLYSWYWPTNLIKGELSESRLLAFGGINTKLAQTSDSGSRHGHLLNVNIGGDKYIHTLSLPPVSNTTLTSSPSSSSSPSPSSLSSSPVGNIVMCHGYAAGLGFYYKNFNYLSQALSEKYHIYAIDWLGMGRSSRPPFPKHQVSDPESSCQQATDFFVSSLEAWRQRVPREQCENGDDTKRGLDKFTLIGHSMGGYLAMQYALKYPQHVERLILLSPVGVPMPPEGTPTVPVAVVADELSSSPSDSNSNMSNSVPEAMALSASPDPGPRSSLSKASASVQTNGTATIGSGTSTGKELPVTVTGRKIPGWINTLWNRNFTPQWIVRSLGPIGPRLVKRYTDFRFQYLPESELKELKEYLYHITADAPSGEYAMASLLRPGAWARAPLWPQFKDLKVRTTFIYGDSDWMDYRHAESSLPFFRVPAKVLRVPYAGHHLYLDNPASFNELLEQEILGRLDSIDSAESSRHMYKHYKEKCEKDGNQDRPSYLY